MAIYSPYARDRPLAIYNIYFIYNLKYSSLSSLTLIWNLFFNGLQKRGLFRVVPYFPILVPYRVSKFSLSKAGAPEGSENRLFFYLRTYTYVARRKGWQGRPPPSQLVGIRMLIRNSG